MYYDQLMTNMYVCMSCMPVIHNSNNFDIDRDLQLSLYNFLDFQKINIFKWNCSKSSIFVAEGSCKPSVLIVFQHFSENG